MWEREGFLKLSLAEDMVNRLVAEIQLVSDKTQAEESLA